MMLLVETDVEWHIAMFDQAVRNAIEAKKAQQEGGVESPQAALPVSSVDDSPPPEPLPVRSHLVEGNVSQPAGEHFAETELSKPFLLNKEGMPCNFSLQPPSKGAALATLRTLCDPAADFGGRSSK